jgi:hypothetical protein
LTFTESSNEQRVFRVTLVLAGALVILAPAIYLSVATIIKPQEAMFDAAGTQLLITLLLVVAIIQPALALLIERFQIRSLMTSRSTAMTAASLFQSISLIKLAFVEAIFIYGLVAYLVSGNVAPMFWLYLVGAIWAAIYWPRRSRFEDFLKKVKVS